MYIILVGDDNSLYGSQKRKIMQREKLFNKLCFLVAPHYNGYDMSKCTVTMRYLMPISKEFKIETLVLSDEKYKVSSDEKCEEYLKYILPIDTNLTKEWGDIELNLTFTLLNVDDVDDDGNIIQRVRKTDNHILHVTQLPNWDSVIPDSALSELDQRIIKQDAQIQALTYLAGVFENNNVDNLVYDDKSDTLQLMAGSKEIGDKVSVKDMMGDGAPVVDLNSEDKPNNGNKPECYDSVIDF